MFQNAIEGTILNGFIDSTEERVFQQNKLNFSIAQGYLVRDVSQVDHDF